LPFLLSSSFISMIAEGYFGERYYIFFHFSTIAIAFYHVVRHCDFFSQADFQLSPFRLP